MSTFAVADQTGLVLLCSIKGNDVSGNTYTPNGVTVTLSDTTNAYLADAGPNGGGFPQFYLVPRQNVPGGTPLTSMVTVNLTVTGTDPVLGGVLPPISLSCDLQVAAPPPAHATVLNVQGSSLVTPTTLPADPGTATITLT